jgi:hypothetical protein
LLFFETLLSEWVMSDKSRVCKPELCGGFQEDIANLLNDRRLLSLTNVKHLEESPVAFTKIQDVAEDLVDEVLDWLLRDDSRSRVPQRLDENRLDDIEILHILFFSHDKAVDNTEGRV